MLLREGKVRTVIDPDENGRYGDDSVIIMIVSDRLSAFDRYVCDIPKKGESLVKLSTWWFNQTNHIINNHLINTINNVMFVKKCQMIPVEFVVRGYLTGNTRTSIWTGYKNGLREFCGNQLPDGLKLDRPLPNIIVTPTTKAKIDIPTSGEQLIADGTLTRSQWDFLHNKALELFKFGQDQAARRGLILADTKYEFGFNHGEILLCDEIHTPDSSRYWNAETYEERVSAGHAPEKIDKDAIRDWVSSRCDPYKETVLPVIPDSLVQHVSEVYSEIARTFVDNQ
jgi:phosphoribosylaminoimidazole-succinocarboxamide synthase